VPAAAIATFAGAEIPPSAVRQPGTLRAPAP